ncbi:methyltransferase domain-containing protein [Rhodospirillaceae bacterium SYSU D60014]|uniref:methyltransferase domain-containing protein n=1 Tax=Virgifigura deserti TaxID=2268457 RepID=UPI000E665AB2
MTDAKAVVERHYSQADLGDKILEAVRAAGKDPNALVPADLTPFDQFHLRGDAATRELAGMAELRPDLAVLDVGSGIGGPARFLATEFGCRVTGLDLTEDFCRTATMLTARTGLADRVSFRQGDALAMPFADGDFDVVWTQHAAMNIADKARLYAESHRVLRPGGRLALNDVLAGPKVDGLHFPVPWASSAELSFLIPPDALRDLLTSAGFRQCAWRDCTDAVIAWFQEMRARRDSAAAEVPGRHLVVGPDFRTRLANLDRNIREERLRVVQAVFERTD